MKKALATIIDALWMRVPPKLIHVTLFGKEDDYRIIMEIRRAMSKEYDCPIKVETSEHAQYTVAGFAYDNGKEDWKKISI